MEILYPFLYLSELVPVLFPEAACHYLPLISDGGVINSLPSHSKHLTVALGEEELEVEPVTSV